MLPRSVVKFATEQFTQLGVILRLLWVGNAKLKMNPLNCSPSVEIVSVVLGRNLIQQWIQSNFCNTYPAVGFGWSDGWDGGDPICKWWCFGLRTRTYAAQRVLGKGSFGTVYQARAKNIQENMECRSVCGFLEGHEWCLSFFFKNISSSWVPSFHLPGPSLGDGWDGAADEFKWLTSAMVMSIRRENWSKPTWERRKLPHLSWYYCCNSCL